eukprot:8463339-Alexandrium_andersonii.AAC.1
MDCPQAVASAGGRCSLCGTLAELRIAVVHRGAAETERAGTLALVTVARSALAGRRATSLA